VCIVVEGGEVGDQDCALGWIALFVTLVCVVSRCVPLLGASRGMIRCVCRGQ